MSITEPQLFLPALNPETVPTRDSSNYPETFHSLVAGRTKQALGEALGLKNFGVNLVKLAPGACSSIRHYHSRQDEFIYILEGELTLVTEAGEQRLKAGMVAGFSSRKSDAHHLLNNSDLVAIYLEVGDRFPGDEVHYPDVDLAAQQSLGKWIFTHKDGSNY
jgi:uncharacterized cupin superfamily protein